MLGRDNVTFQTQIRPLPFNNYAIDELKNGVDVTFVMSARQADTLLPELSVRDEVSYVASYLITKPLTLMASATNPNVHIPFAYEDLRCSSGLSWKLYSALHAAAVQASSSSGASSSSEASDSAILENTVINFVYIYILSSAEPLALLTEHGITPHTVSEPNPDRHKLGTIIADVPLSLLDELNSLEQVFSVFPERRLQPADRVGSATTDKINPPAHTDIEHNKDHTDSSIGIGVIDRGFAGFAMAETLSDTDISFMCHFPESMHYTHTNAAWCDGNPPTDHGTQVAEFITDMAPGIKLYLIQAENLIQIDIAVKWLLDKDVDTIYLSGTYHLSSGNQISVGTAKRTPYGYLSDTYLFDGSGNGTSSNELSLSDIMGYATGQGVSWVNTADNLEAQHIHAGTHGHTAFANHLLTFLSYGDILSNSASTMSFPYGLLGPPTHISSFIEGPIPSTILLKNCVSQLYAQHIPLTVWNRYCQIN